MLLAVQISAIAGGDEAGRHFDPQLHPASADDRGSGPPLVKFVSSR
jgi:hypothetical protein